MSPSSAWINDSFAINRNFRKIGASFENFHRTTNKETIRHRMLCRFLFSILTLKLTTPPPTNRNAPHRSSTRDTITFRNKWQGIETRSLTQYVHRGARRLSLKQYSTQTTDNIAGNPINFYPRAIETNCNHATRCISATFHWQLKENKREKGSPQRLICREKEVLSGSGAVNAVVVQDLARRGGGGVARRSEEGSCALLTYSRIQRREKDTWWRKVEGAALAKETARDGRGESV